MNNVKYVKRRSPVLSGCFILMLSFCIRANADNIWQGKASNNWNEPSNWSLGRVPSGDDGEPVVIADVTKNGGKEPVVTGKAEVYERLVVEDGGRIVFDEGSQLLVFIRSSGDGVHVNGVHVKKGGYLKANGGSSILIDTYKNASRIHNVGTIRIDGKFEAVGSEKKRVVIGGNGTIILGMEIGEKAVLILEYTDIKGAYNIFRFNGYISEFCKISHLRNTAVFHCLNLDHKGDILRITDSEIKVNEPIKAGVGGSRTEFDGCSISSWYGIYTKNTGKEWGIATNELVGGWVVSRNDLTSNGGYIYYPGWKGMDWDAASVPPTEKDRIIVRGSYQSEERRWVRLTGNAACQSITIEKNAGLDLNGCTLKCESVRNHGTIYLNSGKIVLPSGDYVPLNDEIERVIPGSPPDRKLSSKNFGIYDNKQSATGSAPETPHLIWAQPYFTGKPKILFLTCDASAREIFELNKRFDFDSDVLLYPDVKILFDSLPGQFASLETLRAVLEEKQYDCLVNYGVTVNYIPSDIQEMIRERIASGMGYLSLLPEMNGMFPQIQVKKNSNKAPWEITESHYITRNFPVKILPETNRISYSDPSGKRLIISGEDTILSVLDQGSKGRMAILGFAGSCNASRAVLPYPMKDGPVGYARYHYENDWAYWELYYNLLGRTVLWTSKKEPAFERMSMELNKETFLRERDNEVIATIGLESNETFKGFLSINLYDKGFRLMKENRKELTLRAGEKEIIASSVPIVGFPSDRYFLMASIEDAKGQKIDWGIVPVQISSALELGTIKTDKEFYRADQPLEVELNVKNNAEKPLSGRISFSLCDSWKRLVLRENREYSISEKQNAVLSFKLQLPSSRLMAGYYTLEASLYDDAGKVLSKQQSVWMPQDPASRFTDFLLGIWTGDPVHPHLRPYLFETWQRLAGATFAVHGGGCSDDELCANNMWTVHENIWHLGSAKVHNEGIRTPCLSNPAVLQSNEKRVKNFVAQRRKLNMLGYPMGEEMALAVNEVCFSKWCQERYRSWLKERYNSLDSLNKEWETKYQSWEEVSGARSIDLKDMPNPAPFVDFRLFMEYVWADTFRQFGEWTRDSNPKVLAGYNCSAYEDNIFEGWGGLSSIGPITDFSIEYYHPWSLEILRCTMPGPYLLVAGYYHGDVTYRFIPWWVMLHGGSGVSYFKEIGYFRHMTPFYEQNHYTSLITESTRDLREGIGRIILSSKRENDGIAIFYSRANVISQWADTYRKTGTGNIIYPSGKFIENLQMQYDFITEQQLLNGKLDNYRILILPSIATLSDKQLEKIADFVNGGGILIADVKAGLYDEHGRRIKERHKIEQLFGFQRTGEKDFQTTREKVPFPEREGFLSAGRENLTVSGGTSMSRYKDGTPAFILNRCGKGKTLYLNGLFDGNDFFLWKAVFEMMGIRRPVSITGTDSSEETYGYESVRFLQGELEYVAVQRPQDIAKEEAFSIHFGRRSHLYDVRRKKYFGYADKTDSILKPGETDFYLLSPYKVEDVEVEISGSEIIRGDNLHYRINLAVSNGRPGDHVMRIEVYQPDGLLSPVYTKNVVSKQGFYEGLLPLALNEEQGIWRIKVIDVISGIIKEVKFVVKGDVEL